MSKIRSLSSILCTRVTYVKTVQSCPYIRTLLKRGRPSSKKLVARRVFSKIYRPSGPVLYNIAGETHQKLSPVLLFWPKIGHPSCFVPVLIYGPCKKPYLWPTKTDKLSQIWPISGWKKTRRVQFTSIFSLRVFWKNSLGKLASIFLANLQVNFLKKFAYIWNFNSISKKYSRFCWFVYF